MITVERLFGPALVERRSKTDGYKQTTSAYRQGAKSCSQPGSPNQAMLISAPNCAPLVHKKIEFLQMRLEGSANRTPLPRVHAFVVPSHGVGVLYQVRLGEVGVATVPRAQAQPRCDGNCLARRVVALRGGDGLAKQRALVPDLLRKRRLTRGDDVPMRFSTSVSRTKINHHPHAIIDWWRTFP